MNKGPYFQKQNIITQKYKRDINETFAAYIVTADAICVAKLTF